MNETEAVEKMTADRGPRDVDIRLNSRIRHPGENEERHVLNAKGRLVDKVGVSYLTYEELQNGQLVKTTVKMGNEEALIMRSGSVSMRFPFSLAEDRPGTYGSGGAEFPVIIRTKELEFNEKDGLFLIKYQLMADNDVLGTYELEFTYTEGTK